MAAGAGTQAGKPKKNMILVRIKLFFVLPIKPIYDRIISAKLSIGAVRVKNVQQS
jgi:hypothetical protein